MNMQSFPIVQVNKVQWPRSKYGNIEWTKPLGVFLTKPLGFFLQRSNLYTSNNSIIKKDWSHFTLWQHIALRYLLTSLLENTRHSQDMSMHHINTFESLLCIHWNQNSFSSSLQTRRAVPENKRTQIITLSLSKTNVWLKSCFDNAKFQ